MTHRKCAYFFEISSSLIFALCFLPSAARSSKKKTMSRGARFQGFLRRVEIFGAGMCDRTAGFYHVLSVFVVLSVSVESAMECQMTRLMKCFLRWVFERCGLPCLCYSKKPPSAATQAFSLRTQALPMFSNISRLPAHVLWHT